MATETPSASKKYVRIEEKIFEDGGPGVGLWLDREFNSISRAKEWVREQNQKFPGSVRVEHPQPKAPEKLRKEEIAALTRAQQADTRRDVPTRKQLPRSFVQSEGNTSSFLRERNSKRNASRVTRNGRAGRGST